MPLYGPSSSFGFLMVMDDCVMACVTLGGFGSHDITDLPCCRSSIHGVHAGSGMVAAFGVQLYGAACSLHTIWYMLCRHTVRQVYLAKQQRYQAALLAADNRLPYMEDRTSDDSVRFLSAFFALSKALGKAVLLARIMCDDPWIQQQAGLRTWNQYRLWFGR